MCESAFSVPTALSTRVLSTLRTNWHNYIITLRLDGLISNLRVFLKGKAHKVTLKLHFVSIFRASGKGFFFFPP